MLERGEYTEIRDMLLAEVSATGTERVPLESAAGRVLAEDVTAMEDVPSFARSPFDGYAFRAADVAEASADNPVTLHVVDYIPAGRVPQTGITAKTAARLMTGAPVPEGADAILPFEKTDFTQETVTISMSVSPGTNIILPGEDVRRGSVLCRRGVRIDAGLAGTLAGQGIFSPEVFRLPAAGVISTGSEILEEGQEMAPGKIYNTNRYSLQAACQRAGCESLYIGTAQDDAGSICAYIQKAAACCDAILLSGGVSVGDYDCTPAAMEMAGVRILARGASLKPGMAGAYGILCGNRNIPVMALSGNPAACMTAFYAIALPVLKKQMGLAEFLPQTLQVRLTKEYKKKNPSTRLLRGRIDLQAVMQEMTVFEKQGNQVLSSLAGTNAFAVLPPGMTLREGEPVEAFLAD